MGKGNSQKVTAISIRKITGKKRKIISFYYDKETKQDKVCLLPKLQ